MSVYQTTLSKRTRPVERSDFDAPNLKPIERTNPGVPNFRLNGAVDLFVLHSHYMEQWEELVPYSPSQVYELFSRGHKQTSHMNFTFQGKGQVSLRTHYTNTKDFDSTVGFILSSSPCARTGLIEIAPALQGQGIGKAELLNRIEFFIAMGMEDYTFSAGNSNGAYTWARAAAQINMKVESHRLYEASLPLQSRISSVRAFMSAADFDKAMTLSEMTDKNDMANLAKMDHIVFPFELAPNKDKLEESLFFKGIRNFYDEQRFFPAPANLRSMKETAYIQRAFESAAAQGKPGLSFPRLVLTGRHFPAVWNFNDAVQMKKIGEYFGGWKTVRPVQDQPEIKLQPAFA